MPEPYAPGINVDQGSPAAPAADSPAPVEPLTVCPLNSSSHTWSTVGTAAVTLAFIVAVRSPAVGAFVRFVVVSTSVTWAIVLVCTSSAIWIVVGIVAGSLPRVVRVRLGAVQISFTVMAVPVKAASSAT